MSSELEAHDFTRNSGYISCKGGRTFSNREKLFEWATRNGYTRVKIYNNADINFKIWFFEYSFKKMEWVEVLCVELKKKVNGQFRDRLES